MLRIGAHMSVAGGVSRAVDRAEVHGCEALQIFSKNANRWTSKPLDAEEVRRFRKRIDETGIHPAVSHAMCSTGTIRNGPAAAGSIVTNISATDVLGWSRSVGSFGIVVSKAGRF